MSTQQQESGGFLRDRAKGGATAGVGLAGVAGGGMLRQRGLQRAHFEDTATPVKRTKLFAERQLARGARGRRTWGAGAALQLAAAPAVAVGGYRAIRGSNKDVTKADRNLLREGLIGARDAARERLSTQSEAPPSFSGSNIAATTGAGLATSGLAAAALRGKKAGPLLRSGALSTAGALGGAASIPAQAKVLEHQTGGEYTITPTGVKRKKKAPKRPSHDATMIDAKSGTVTPSGVRKDDGDYGATLSRAQRRAIVSGAGGLPIPVIGDAAQAAAAGRLAAPGNRKRTAAEVLVGNNVGNLAGAAAGGLGAAYLAERSPAAARRMTAVNEGVERAKGRASRAVPEKVRSAAGKATGKTSFKKPSVPARIAGSKAGRLVARNKAPAAAGALIGGMAGGQSAMQTVYGHAMNRDDRYRDANRLATRGSSVAKRDTQAKREKHLLADKKRRQAALSVLAGGAGIGALGATAGTALTPRIPKATKAGKIARRVAPRLEKTKTPLLTVSSGVAGAGSMNFAGLQRQEADELDPYVKKALRPRVPGVRRGYIRRARVPSGLIRTSSVGGSLR